MLTVSYIDDDSSLTSFCAAPATSLMVDTEFLREKTYFPKLCLVQVATEHAIALIDPLAGIDLEPLWARFDDTELVLHAARQDLEVLSGAAGRLPARIFDTQIAAGLAGLPPQIGYAGLVREVAGIELDKSHTRTNWSRRPLGAGELDYAADDVRYLASVHGHLSARLTELGRLDWAREDSQALLAGELYAPSGDDAWRRVKGITRLDGRAFGRAAALAAWREQRAVARNLPRQWILKDGDLLGLASARDPSERVRDCLSRRSRDAAQVLRVLADSGDGPPPPTSSWPSPEERELARELARRVRDTAAALGLEPEVLAPQKELRALAAGRRDTRVFSGWRRDIVAEALLPALA